MDNFCSRTDLQFGLPGPVRRHLMFIGLKVPVRAVQWPYRAKEAELEVGPSTEVVHLYVLDNFC